MLEDLQECSRRCALSFCTHGSAPELDKNCSHGSEMATDENKVALFLAIVNEFNDDYDMSLYRHVAEQALTEEVMLEAVCAALSRPKDEFIKHYYEVTIPLYSSLQCIHVCKPLSHVQKYYAGNLSRKQWTKLL